MIDMNHLVIKSSQNLFNTPASVLNDILSKVDTKTVIVLDNIEVMFPIKMTRDSIQLSHVLQSHFGDTINNQMMVIGVSTADIQELEMTIGRLFCLNCKLDLPGRAHRLLFLDRLSVNTNVDRLLQLSADDLEYLAGKSFGFLFADLQALFQKILHNVNSQLDRQKLDRLIEESRQSSSLLRRAQGIHPDMVITTKGQSTGKENDAILQPEIAKLIAEIEGSPSQHNRPLTFNGILLYGPPGSGKTQCAKQISSRLNYNLFNLSIPQLVKAEIGESEKALAKAFQAARDCSPCVLFLDEVDAVFGGSRVGQLEGSERVLKKLLCQLIVELDSLRYEQARRQLVSGQSSDINSRESVLVIAATNLPFALDSTLLRAGRLDRHILLSIPSSLERLAYIEQKIVPKLSGDPDKVKEKLVELTADFSWADLNNLNNNACMKALQRCMTGTSETDHVLLSFEMDLLPALREIRPSCSSQLLLRYTEWSFK